MLYRIIQKTEVHNPGNFGMVEQNQLRILDCGLRRAKPSRLQIEITDLP